MCATRPEVLPLFYRPGVVLAMVCVLAALAAFALGFTVGRVTSGGNAARSLPQAVENAPGRCGIERWAVKTLTDPAASEIDFQTRPSTVAALAALPAPATEPTSRLDAEKVVYRVRATLLAMKQEADSDIHLAVADPAAPDTTMIVEFPAGYCETGSPSHVAQINAARRVFEKACGTATGRYKTLRGSAEITGVAFLDRIHGQLGVARNGIELHPALAFRLLSPTC